MRLIITANYITTHQSCFLLIIHFIEIKINWLPLVGIFDVNEKYTPRTSLLAYFGVYTRNGDG